MNKTSISWTDFSSNPLYVVDKETGKRGWLCEKVSPGCAHCYASALNVRRGTGHAYIPANRDKVQWRLNERELDAIRRRRKPTRIFMCDMTDLFHEDVPDGFIAWVWLTMARAGQHTFQVLTKRPERMKDFLARWNDLSGESSEPQLVRGPQATRERHPSGRGQLFAAYLDELGKPSGGVPPPGAAWPTFDWMEGPRWWPTIPLPNVWIGVSVENQRMADERIPVLLDTPAAVRFLSCEPLLGALDLSRYIGYQPQETRPTTRSGRSLSLIIVGGESGPGSAERKLVVENWCGDDCPYTVHTGWRPKPQALEWVRSLRDQAVAAGVPFFFKQWGGPKPSSAGALIDGREWRQMP